MELQTILQIAGPLVYLIGTGIIIRFQKTKLDALKTQLEAQNGMLANAERIVNIFRPEVTEGYVALIEKKAKLEKENALIKLNDEWKLKADKGISFLLSEYETLTGALVDLIFSFPRNTILIRAIESMKDTQTKKVFTLAREKAEGLWNDTWHELGIDPTSEFALTKMANGIYPIADHIKTN